MISTILNNQFFHYFGLSIFIYLLIKTCLRLWNNFTTFYLGHGRVDFKKYGSWAVVTGCTDGIGKEYCEQFAIRGLNLVLISRTLEKLQQQAKYLNETYKIDTKIIVADFTESNSIYPEIKRQISDLDIGVLFNNVGMFFGDLSYFHEVDETICNNLIICNTVPVVKMTSIVLPIMLNKKKGIIINNSSGTAMLPFPFLNVYSASKAFVDYFSRSISVEYKSKGIIIQSLCPFLVSTKLSNQPESFRVPSTKKYVQSSIDTIGTQLFTNGYLVHNFLGWLYREFLPNSVFYMLITKLAHKRMEKRRKLN